jgi:hypothetical protein
MFKKRWKIAWDKFNDRYVRGVHVAEAPAPKHEAKIKKALASQTLLTANCDTSRCRAQVHIYRDRRPAHLPDARHP